MLITVPVDPFHAERHRPTPKGLRHIIQGCIARGFVERPCPAPKGLKLISNFVMGSLFLVLPSLWFGAMTWAGFNLGNMASSFTNGTRASYEGGSQGGDVAKSAGKAFMDGLDKS